MIPAIIITAWIAIIALMLRSVIVTRANKLLRLSLHDHAKQDRAEITGAGSSDAFIHIGGSNDA